MKMPIPQRLVEDVERRAGPRIDLENGEILALDQHVEAVEPDKAERVRKRIAGLGDPCGETRRQRDGTGAAAVAEWRRRARRGPLPAVSDNSCGASIRHEQRRNRLAGREGLV